MATAIDIQWHITSRLTAERSVCTDRSVSQFFFYEEFVFLSLFHKAESSHTVVKVIGTSCYTLWFLKACVLPSSYTDSVQALIKEIQECAGWSDCHILLHRALIQTRQEGTAIPLPFILWYLCKWSNDFFCSFFSGFQTFTILLAPSKCAILMTLHMTSSTICKYTRYYLIVFLPVLKLLFVGIADSKLALYFRQNVLHQGGSAAF